jgi:hypothetical protein
VGIYNIKRTEVIIWWSLKVKIMNVLLVRWESENKNILSVLYNLIYIKYLNFNGYLIRGHHTRICCLHLINVEHWKFEFSRTNFVLLALILEKTELFSNLGSKRTAVFSPSGPNGYTVRGFYDPHRTAIFYR